MVNVTKSDVDAACAAYANATGDYPRREGIRVALHSYRQMSDIERYQVEQLFTQLDRIANGQSGHTALLRKLLGLRDGQ